MTLCIIFPSSRIPVGCLHQIVAGTDFHFGMKRIFFLLNWTRSIITLSPCSIVSECGSAHSWNLLCDVNGFVSLTFQTLPLSCISNKSLWESKKKKKMGKLETQWQPPAVPLGGLWSCLHRNTMEGRSSFQEPANKLNIPGITISRPDFKQPIQAATSTF